ncbi:MAG: helix-turn-helix transcriptional regulator [Coriobacteriales bacterium]|nr:helix-turn-helix transcriptional regulator [Coriobacteriales bacterium]
MQLPDEFLPIPTIHLLDSLGAGLFALILALLARRLTTAKVCLSISLVFGVLGALSTCGLLFEMQGVLDYKWNIALNMAVTVCSVWFTVAWLDLLATQGVKGAACCFIVATALGGLCGSALQAMPFFPSFFVLVLMPIMTALGLRMTKDVSLSRFSRAKHPHLRSLFADTPFSLLLVVGLVCFSQGVLFNIDITSAVLQSGSWVIEPIFDSLVMIAAVLLAFFSVRSNVRLAFYTAIPCVLIASLLLAIGVDEPRWILVSLVRLGAETIRFLVIFLLVKTMLEKRIPALPLFALLTCCQFLGTMLGQLVSIVFTNNHMMIALFLLSDLVIAALVILFAHTALGAMGQTRQTGGASEASLQSLSKQSALTPRECEVLGYWISGHNSSFIEERLNISKHTVKTHINHIYEKTNTRNKEELIRLYEQFQQKARRF